MIRKGEIENEKSRISEVEKKDKKAKPYFSRLLT